MQVGDVVSESIEFGIPWAEAEKYDQTQRGVVFKKSKGMFYILWFDTRESSFRTDYWARSDSVKIINASR
jgi:hypothetical protein